MAAAASSGPRPSGGKPGWLIFANSMPNKVAEPNFDAYMARVKALSDERQNLYDKLELLGFQRKRPDPAEEDERRRKEEEADPARAAYRKEQQALRDKINGLRDKQNDERSKAKEKREELFRMRDERRELERQMQALTGEVGLFSSVTEVEDAMDRLLYKMETGIGDLKAEKLCSKRLAQLENVKLLLEKLGPMEDAIRESEENEAALASEARNIHHHLTELNDEIETTLRDKIEKGKARGAENHDAKAQREARNAEKSALLDKARAVSDQIKKVRADFDESKKLWNEFKEVAKAKYAEEQKRKREDYERRRQEMEAKRKAERKQRRAAQKLNPHEAEIAICETLARVLKDREEGAEQDRIKAERARKLAEFDASKAAPQGQVLKQDDEDWLFADRSSKGNKGGGKNKNKSAAAPAAKSTTTAPSPSTSINDRQLHLPAERIKQCERIQVSAPSKFGDIKTALEAIAAQKKFYESKKKSLDEVTTDESTEAEDEAEAENPVARAAAAAVAAVVAVEEGVVQAAASALAGAVAGEEGN